MDNDEMIPDEKLPASEKQPENKSNMSSSPLRSPSINWNQSARSTIRTSLGRSRLSISGAQPPKPGVKAIDSSSTKDSAVSSPALDSPSAGNALQESFAKSALGNDKDVGADLKCPPEARESPSEAIVESSAAPDTPKVNDNVTTNQTDIHQAEDISPTKTVSNINIAESSDGGRAATHASGSETNLPQGHILEAAVRAATDLSSPNPIGESFALPVNRRESENISSADSYEPIDVDVDDDDDNHVLLNIVETPEIKEGSGLESGEISESAPSNNKLRDSHDSNIGTDSAQDEVDEELRCLLFQHFENTVTKADCEKLFEGYRVESISILRNPKQAFSALVIFSNAHTARSAKFELDNQLLGQPVTLQLSRVPEAVENLTDDPVSDGDGDGDEADNSSALHKNKLDNLRKGNGNNKDKVMTDVSEDEGEVQESSGNEGDPMMLYANADATPNDLTPSQMLEAGNVPLTLSDLGSDELRAQVRYFYVARDPQTIPSTDPVRCLVCTQPGHMAASCPSLKCSKCGAYNDHFSHTCPKTQVCPKCRQRGHSQDKCTSKLKATAEEFPCALCKCQGHVESDCEVHWRTSGYPWIQDLSIHLNFSCYECGAGGHLGNDCPTRRPGKALGTSTWTARPVSAPPRAPKGPSIPQYSAPQFPQPRARHNGNRRNPIQIPDDNDDGNTITASFLRPPVPPPARSGQMRIATSEMTSHRRTDGWNPSNAGRGGERHGLPPRPPQRRQESGDYGFRGGPAETRYRDGYLDDEDAAAGGSGRGGGGSGGRSGRGNGSRHESGRPSRRRGRSRSPVPSTSPRFRRDGGGNNSSNNNNKNGGGGSGGGEKTAGRGRGRGRGGKGRGQSGGGGGGGGGTSSAAGDSYRPMPSSAAKAWKKGR